MSETNWKRGTLRLLLVVLAIASASGGLFLIPADWLEKPLDGTPWEGGEWIFGAALFVIAFGLLLEMVTWVHNGYEKDIDLEQYPPLSTPGFRPTSNSDTLSEEKPKKSRIMKRRFWNKGTRRLLLALWGVVAVIWWVARLDDYPRPEDWEAYDWAIWLLLPFFFLAPYFVIRWVRQGFEE